MTSNFFPIERSVLSSDALRKHLLDHYDLPSPITCRLYSRYATDIYHVEAGDEHFWLRVYHHDEFTHAEIEAEVTILNELARHNLSVVRLAPDRKGTYFHHLPAPEGERYSVLTIHAPGTAPGREINAVQAARYGEAVAQLHLTLDIFPQRYERPQIGLTELLDEPLAHLQPMLRKRPADWHFFCELAEQLKQVLAQLPTHTPAYGLCHGDLHKSNIIMDEQGRLTMIDWDCLGYGWRAYELAVLRWSIGPAVGPEGIGVPQTAEVWNAYLQAYTALRPLSAVEHAALPYFVVARQIQVCGWDIQRALDGRLGTWFLTDRYFDHWIGVIQQWMAAECKAIPRK